MDRSGAVIVGPTGSGKTSLAIAFAKQAADVGLISIDSMTIYREFSLGTAKPTEAELGGVAQYLFDVVSISQEYSLGQYLRDVRRARIDLGRRGLTPVFVGGTPLYFRGVVDDLQPPPRYVGLRAWLESRATVGGVGDLWFHLLQQVDPKAASQIEAPNLRRIIRALEVRLGSGQRSSVAMASFVQHPPSPYVIVGLDVSPQELTKRLELRLEHQFALGWLEEVAELIAKGTPWSKTAEKAIGYRELRQVVSGSMSLATAKDEILRRTRRLAKRQRAWLKRDPRIKWISDMEDALEYLNHWHSTKGTTR